MVYKIEFDGREAARPTRKDQRLKPFLAPGDDARTGTVVLKDNAPQRLVDKVAGEAAETREKEAEKFGQVPLSENERNQIDFQKTSVPAARAAKGIATGKGVDDFISYFDEELTVDEHREVFESAKKEGGGKRDTGREKGKNAQRLAEANKRRKEQAGDRLKDYALLQQDDEAQNELRSRGGNDLLDIGFSRNNERLKGKGDDFRRLRERHEQRSERAQSVDERRSAKKTRDPVKWVNNPGEFDFPGIDTVQPEKLHEQRPEMAQRVDERENAPIADSKEQWAQNPGNFDWPGVDDPSNQEDDDSMFNGGLL